MSHAKEGVSIPSDEVAYFMGHPFHKSTLKRGLIQEYKPKGHILQYKAWTHPVDENFSGRLFCIIDSVNQNTDFASDLLHIEQLCQEHGIYDSGMAQADYWLNVRRRGLAHGNMEAYPLGKGILERKDAGHILTDDEIGIIIAFFHDLDWYKVSEKLKAGDLERAVNVLNTICNMQSPKGLLLQIGRLYSCACAFTLESVYTADQVAETAITCGALDQIHHALSMGITKRNFYEKLLQETDPRDIEITNKLVTFMTKVHLKNAPRPIWFSIRIGKEITFYCIKKMEGIVSIQKRSLELIHGGAEPLVKPKNGAYVLDITWTFDDVRRRIFPGELLAMNAYKSMCQVTSWVISILQPHKGEKIEMDREAAQSVNAMRVYVSCNKEKNKET